MAKKLLVLFPGRNYSCDKPLLYYAGKIFEERGYEVIRLSYNADLKTDKDNIKGLIEEAYEKVKSELDRINFLLYEDVVFVSKSIGTALAGRYEKKTGRRIRHIYLTPVSEALQYMSRGKCLVVAGKEDRYLDGRRLKIYCVEQDIPLKQFDEVGHALEHPKDINITFAILMVIVRMYKEF